MYFVTILISAICTEMNRTPRVLCFDFKILKTIYVYRINAVPIHKVRKK